MPWILGSLIIGMLIGAACAYLLAAKRIHRSVERVQSARKRAQAAERLAEIGSMTGGLAHEIKNPLSTIGLNAQLLSEAIEGLDIPDNDRTRLLKRIEALGRETDRLRGILEDFLEYAGELRLSVNLRQVNLIVEELADFFSPMVQGAGVRMRLELDPSDPSALVDADHLKQAILNLMLNALHAMGQPGSQQDELIVRTELTQSSADGRGVHIHVIDTGPGIDEQTRERIFHPYFTTKSGGTGLGLPTARRIIEAHHGRLELHSEVGKGSDFVLVIPAHSSNED
jgi:signal transduction histidine kinase